MDLDMPWANLEPAERELAEDVFHTAVSLPPADRASFVRAQLGGRSVLITEILELAHTFEEQEEVGGWKNPELVPLNSDDSQIGRRVGSWYLESLIGRGGMGSVYLASRQDGQFEQLAALKLLSCRISSEWLEDRFRQERQNLARLNHPNIARLIDGGTTAERDPYLVMEYVEGAPLDDYCRSRELSIRQRVELFLRVCDAVTYTHQNLLIHRDLKPDNILVCEDGTPKLLDFGTAKRVAMDAEEPGTTVVGMRAFTPAYASPEEILGEPITTAADVYSLGVILYRLLAGSAPYALTEFNTGELIRVVCQQEPALPSVAVAHKGEARAIAGDLDNIVMKALEKAPEQRFGSVAEMADDLRRHLEGRPVRSHAGGGLYRMAKFVRRNAFSVASATLAVVALLATTFYSWRQSVRANLAAEKQAEVSGFLTSILQGTDSILGANKDRSVKDLLLKSADELDRRKWSSPDVESTVRRLIGASLAANSDFANAERHYRKALLVARQAGNREEEVLAYTGLGEILSNTQRAAEAIPLLRQTIVATEGATSPAMRSARYGALSHLGQNVPAEADRWFPEAIRYGSTLPDLSPDALLSVYNGYVIHMTSQSRMAEAADYTARGVEVFRREVARGRKMPAGARIVSSRALIFARQGDFVNYEKLNREYKDHLLDALGPNHRLTLYARAIWARGLAATGRQDQALAELAEVDRAFYQLFPKGHPNSFMVESAAAFAHNLAGLGVEAERHALLAKQSAGPEKSTLLAEALRELGTAKLLQGRREEAVAVLRESLQIYAATMGKSSRNYQVAEARLQQAEMPKGSVVKVTP